MQKIPVYVISLESARERRAQVKAHLDGLKIEYQVISAVEGAKLDPGYREIANPSKNMSPGALGCCLSHFRAYENIIANQLSVALILEDDVVLHYSVKALLENGCQNLDFDYCFLGSEDHGDEGYVFYDADSAVELGGGEKAYLLSSGPYCLHAYLITLRGAEKRMACALPVGGGNIDHYHFLPYRPRFRAIIPLLAFVTEQSAIESVAAETWSISQKQLHRYWWFYPLRDLVKLKGPRKWLSLKKSNFPYAGRWRSFSSAAKVVRRNRLER